MSGTGESFNEGFPPIVTESKGRTHCDACGDALAPDIMHKCDGNKEWKPPRRMDPTRWSPTEHAIFEAKTQLSLLPANEHTTKAELLINEAMFHVANFIDSVQS